MSDDEQKPWSQASPSELLDAAEAVQAQIDPAMIPEYQQALATRASVLVQAAQVRATQEADATLQWLFENRLPYMIGGQR